MSRLGEILTQILTDLKHAKRKQDKRKMDALLFELQEYTFNLFSHLIKPKLRNKEDAGVILLNTYERAFMYVESFNSLKDGFRWFFQIAKTQTHDFLRKSTYKNAVPLQDVDYRLSEQSFEADHFIELIDLRRARKFLSAIDNQIIDCCFFKGYSFEKTGKIVGLAKSTVHERLSKILKNLYEKLKKDRTK